MSYYHFIGIGGMGMSALAQLLVHNGHTVTGSDRRSEFELRNKLCSLGIKIFNQNGSGINIKVNKVVISRAIETDNPDLIKANELNIPVVYRQDILKELFRSHPGIAVAGTSGKTTVTGMIGCILSKSGQGPTIACGGIMNNSNNNIQIGRLPYYCVETDESEGNLKGFRPLIGVLTNIGFDHMPPRKLTKVFRDFINEIEDILVINADCSFKTRKKNKITFGINNKADLKAYDIRLMSEYTVFKVDRCEVKVASPGLHNVYNSLAALGAVKACGISVKDAVYGLEKFKGIKRRFEVLGKNKGIRLVDDYAHNPDKIKASINTAQIGGGRLIVVYQPHGYKPARMFFDELVNVFSCNLTKNDFLIMPEIFYAGGTVTKDISSREIIGAVTKKNKRLKAIYLSDRSKIVDKICSRARPGDTVLVMGARDRSLSVMGRLILKGLN